MDPELICVNSTRILYAANFTMISKKTVLDGPSFKIWRVPSNLGIKSVWRSTLLEKMRSVLLTKGFKFSCDHWLLKVVITGIHYVMTFRVLEIAR